MDIYDGSIASNQHYRYFALGNQYSRQYFIYIGIWFFLLELNVFFVFCFLDFRQHFRVQSESFTFYAIFSIELAYMFQCCTFFINLIPLLTPPYFLYFINILPIFLSIFLFYFINFLLILLSIFSLSFINCGSITEAEAPKAEPPLYGVQSSHVRYRVCIEGVVYLS